MVQESSYAFEWDGLLATGGWVRLFFRHCITEDVMEAVLTVVMLTWYLVDMIHAELILAGEASEKLRCLVRSWCGFISLRVPRPG